MGIHDCLVLLCFISRFNVSLIDNIELSSSVVNVFVANNASLNVDIESLSTLCEIGPNSVAD